MIISHHFKCIFIHIQKCAGTSITYGLENYLAPGDIILGCTDKGEDVEKTGGYLGLHKHSKSDQIKETLGSEIWQNYFKFTIVRNPWDRAVSTYHWWLRTKYVGENNKGNIIRNMSSFKEYVMSDLMYGDNCCHYINDDINYIGRFEKLDSSFAYICGRLGLPDIKLKKKNPSKHDHYSKYYDNELIEKINTIFADDINIFGYQYEKT